MYWKVQLKNNRVSFYIHIAQHENNHHLEIGKGF